MKLIFTSLILVCGLPAQVLPPIIAGRDMGSLKTGLVGWWKMDEGNYGTTSIDSSGNGFTGTFSGTALGATSYYSAGKVGLWDGAYSISPANVGTSLSVADNATLQFGTGDFSMSAWIYPYTTNYGVSSEGAILGKTNAAGSTGFECLIYQSTLACQMAGTAINGVIPVTPGNWYFVAATRKSGVVSLYVNAVADTTATRAGNVSAIGTGLTFGARPGTAFNYWGLIGDGRLYNRALSVREIQQLYSSQTAAIPAQDRIKLIANNVITNDHMTFNDATDGWIAAPFYGTTTTYLQDLTLAMTGNPAYFTSAQVLNIISKTIAGRNGSGDLPGSLNAAAVGGGFTDPCNTLNLAIEPEVAMSTPLLEKLYYDLTGSTARFAADAAILKTALTNGSIKFSGTTGLVTVPTGIAGGNYTSGGTITGTAGQTITVALGGPGTGAAGTFVLSSTNTVAANTGMGVLTSGTGYNANPTSGTCSNGTATCTGTITLTAQSQIYTPWAGMDGVQFTGDNMFASVHYYRGMLRMAELYTLIGDSTNAAWATAQAAIISNNIASLWDATDGMFYASSGQNHQIDIFGSSYAVAVGLATPTQSTAISNWLATNYSSIVLRGLVRQSNANWAVSWGGNQCGRGTGNYDDGHWGYGVGFVAVALAYANPASAVRLLNENVLGSSTLENIGRAAANGASSNMSSPQGLVKFVNDNPGLFR